MTMKWFKLHHDLPDDIKLRRFSPQEKWAWVVLLCLASKSKDRGIIQADNDDIADYCEFNSTQDWLYYRDKLIQKGMLEFNGDGNLLICHWEDRQYEKPSDRPSAIKERVDRHRAKKKAEVETPCNALQPQCNATDTDTEIRSETDPKIKGSDRNIVDSSANAPAITPSIDSASKSGWQRLQEIYNQHKPALWAELQVVNDKRRKVLVQLIKDCGGVDNAIAVLTSALQFANTDTWYCSRKLSFENFASNNKIIQLHERQQRSQELPQLPSSTPDGLAVDLQVARALGLYN